jgi:cytochrome c
MKRSLVSISFFCFVLFLFCWSLERANSKSSYGPVPTAMERDAGPQQSGTADSSDKGIGPVKDLNLGPVDQKLAQEGESIFQNRCSTCHSLDVKKVGPPLGNVLQRVTPEFVMNFLLNTTEMEQKDERIKKLIDEYGVPMPNLGLDHDQARAVLEYFRTTGKLPGSVIF